MKILLIALVATTVAIGCEGASAQTYCNDGTYSGSSGSGTCSHHGGEYGNNHVHHGRGYILAQYNGYNGYNGSYQYPVYRPPTQYEQQQQNLNEGHSRYGGLPGTNPFVSGGLGGCLPNTGCATAPGSE